MSWDNFDPDVMPWESVTEHAVTATAEELALVEAVKRYPGPKGRTNPIYVTCKDRHETGLTVSLGTRDNEVVLTFRAKNFKGLEGTAAVAAVNTDGPKGHGDEDRSTGWRLFCPLCFDRTPGGVKPPEWVAEEALRRLREGVKINQKTGRWPQLHLSWT